MSFKFLGGQFMNALATATAYGAAPTATPEASASADASYPLANLYNGVTALPWRLAAQTTGCYIRWANNLVPNGDMENAALFNSADGWQATSGATIAQTGTYYAKGTQGMSVAATGTGFGAYRDVTVQAGAYYQVWASLRGNGTQSAWLHVRCLDTMQDLNSSGVWTTFGTPFAARATASFAAYTGTFQAPTFATLGKPTATLRVYCVASAAGTVYFDEVFIIPAIDFVGVFGHGFDSTTGLTLNTNGANYWHSPSSSVNFGTAGNAACAKPVAIVTNGARVYDPFPEVRFHPGGAFGTYTSRVAPWVGELVVGQTRTFQRSPQSFVLTPQFRGQQRQATSGGTPGVYNANAHAIREARMGLQTGTLVELQGMEQDFLGLSEGGRWPMVLLPQGLDASMGLLGRVTDTMAFDVTDLLGYSTTEVVLTEEPLPRL